jgi:tRNA/rRNA methyltransferase
MNLGQAVAVCLYELARTAAVDGKQSKMPPEPKKKDSAATAGEVDRITELLLEALRASGYLGQRPVAAKEEKVRRMVHRLNLSATDAEVWLGMLRQIIWKLDQQK